MKKMTRWGIGPKFAILTILYALTLYLINLYVDWHFLPMKYTGSFLISIGTLLFLYPAVTIDKYFNEGKLRVTGLYAIVRHPIYATWIVIIIPGIVLLSGGVLYLTLPFVSYFIFRRFIYVEENYLLIMFGRQYMIYAKKVNAIWPKLFSIVH